MKRVKLLVERPLMFKGQFTFYKVGHIFEVIAEKEIHLMGLGYKLKDIFWNIEIEGWNSAKDFEDVVRK